jgi:tetratricopeptide (TPR) repeat protein
MLKDYVNPRRSRAVGIWLLAALVLVPSFLTAHPGIETRIEIVTEKIRQDPGNAELYVRRGELHREHRDWDAALADFGRAAELDPGLATVHLARGLLYFDTERFAEAATELDRFLLENPNDSRGRTARARVWVQLGKHAAAAEDYDRAVAHSPRLTPQLYLERARAWAGAGERHVGRAILGLDEGMEKLGRIVTLQSFAIELDLRVGSYDSALKRLDQIAGSLPKERLLRRRGDILRAAGRNTDARFAYTQAADHIDSLPPHRQSAKPLTELRGELKAALAEIVAAAQIQSSEHK